LQIGDPVRRDFQQLNSSNDSVPVALGVIGDAMAERPHIDGSKAVVDAKGKHVPAGSKRTKIECMRSAERGASALLHAIDPHDALPMDTLKV